MDWFERITGFREGDYASTRERLAVEGETLVSRVDGSRHGIGRLEVPTLAALRGRMPALLEKRGRTTVRCMGADARALHSQPEFAGALFQVASQFNLLEMVAPHVTPEEGVTGYAYDATQGPACAIAVGAATIYRNYFAPVSGMHGQTATRQIDALAPLGRALGRLLDRPVDRLWSMRNGYALASPEGLAAIGALLRDASEASRDALRAELAIGVQTQAEVTDGDRDDRRRVSQAFCSALPVAYTHIASAMWEPLARLVLEATYESTLLAACENHRQHGSATVLLTRVGGGAFGNDDDWIDAAIERGLRVVEHAGLDVRLVSFRSVHPAMRGIEQRWAHRA